MFRKAFPFLRRPVVEFTLNCASFILFCASFVRWIAQF